MDLFTTFFIGRALSPGPLAPQASCWAKFPSDFERVRAIRIQRCYSPARCPVGALKKDRNCFRHTKQLFRIIRIINYTQRTVRHVTMTRIFLN